MNDRMSERFEDDPLEKRMAELRDWKDDNLRALVRWPTMGRRERRDRGIRESLPNLQLWANCALMVLEERRKFQESAVPTRRGEYARPV